MYEGSKQQLQIILDRKDTEIAELNKRLLRIAEQFVGMFYADLHTAESNTLREIAPFVPLYKDKWGVVKLALLDLPGEGWERIR